MLTADKTTSRKEFVHLFSAMHEARREVQDIFIRGRLRIVANMTTEEFEIVVAQKPKVTDAHWKKLGQQFDKGLSHMTAIVQQMVTAPEQQRKALAAIEEFKEGSERLLEAVAHWNYQDNQVLRNFGASEEALQASIDELNSFRKQMSIAFIDLHMQLAESSTENEWAAASKAMESLIK